MSRGLIVEREAGLSSGMYYLDMVYNIDLPALFIELFGSAMKGF